MVTQKRLFNSLGVVRGAAAALRRLCDDEVGIRIITHRLFVPHFHAQAVTQTIDWLDQHGIPYWDLCFMTDKSQVGADVYVEDTPKNIQLLKEPDCDVIVFTNSTNRDVDAGDNRANDWDEAERKTRQRLSRRPMASSANTFSVGPSRASFAKTSIALMMRRPSRLSAISRRSGA